MEVDSTSSASTRPREEDDNDSPEPAPKRVKTDEGASLTGASIADGKTDPDEVTADNVAQPVEAPNYVTEDLLPPSRSLLSAESLQDRPQGQINMTLEVDVGITEYVSKDIPPIQGIIKQRFTDFLVFEVGQDSNVIHLNSIAKPEGPPKAPRKPKVPKPPADAAPITSEAPPIVEPGGGLEDTTFDIAQLTTLGADEESGKIEQAAAQTEPLTPAVPMVSEDPWPERFTTTLAPVLAAPVIEKLKELFLEGLEPPFKSDSGWGGRKGQGDEPPSEEVVAEAPDAEGSATPTRGKNGSRGRRGGRGDRGRGRGRGGRFDSSDNRPGKREDTRKVLSDPLPDKAKRTALHQTIRELFGGKFETEAEDSKGDEGPRIAIKWNHRRGKGGKVGRNPREPRDPDKPQLPSYIQFTMQKANRDTQDALGHVSRLLRCHTKDLAVAGTKDKRGVTTQRVSLRRQNKTLEEVWKNVNAVPARRTAAQAVTSRGERGVRIGDLSYSKTALELGMLKGNAFVITLRNVKVDSEDILNLAMESIKQKGFVNYYGMQRFGTSSVPTHAIGLALLQSDWKRAISLILRPRPGEFPEAEAARRAWLEDHDLEKALELMPRRVVAERCILEAFKKNFGTDTDLQGALTAVPRNLRLMYVHAYQSYVWNAIVSERIRRYGCDKPVVGDLVYAKEIAKVSPEDKAKGDEPAATGANGESTGPGPSVEVDTDEIDPDTIEEDDAQNLPSGLKSRGKPFVAPKVKTLTESDLPDYDIFDVIMPLPGFDVAYPSGDLGEKYQAFMKADGLDPNNMARNRKDYSLAGSYRKIMYRPRHVSWSILRYTDPDVPLAQSDEDKILGVEPPVTNPEGKFLALQINLELGSSVYATMALRELTKTETSAHYQTGLTQASEDQLHKGTETEGLKV